MKKKNSNVSDSAKGKNLILASAFGVMIGMLVFFILIMSFSAICLFFDNPHIFIYPFSFFFLYASAFFAGFSAVKKNGSHDALLCGSISGALLMLIYIIIFAAIAYFIPNTSSSNLSFLWRVLIIPSSIFGGYIASAAPTSKKSRRF